MVPRFIIERIQLATLMLDKGLAHGSFRDRFRALPQLIEDYLANLGSGFVSNNSLEFKDYLEEQLGEVQFIKPFAVRVRPDSFRLFIDGREIFGE